MNLPLSRKSHLVQRRAVLRNGVLCLAGLGGSFQAAEDAKPTLRAGLMTDLHYADKEAAGTRFYREALDKLDEAVGVFEKEKPAFVVELGDFIDQAETAELELEWLARMESHYARLSMPRHYVLGNHCVTTLTKAEFIANTGMSKTPHYAFDEAGVRFIVLDACYREDGEAYGRDNFDWKDTFIPQAELDWLQTQLAAAKGPVVIFAHQRLDESAPHNVKNASAVRTVLEKSGKVLAVFQGHSHKNDYQQIAGIHYTTLVAMVEGSGLESSGYTMLDVMPDHSLRLHGYRRQIDRELK